MRYLLKCFIQLENVQLTGNCNFPGGTLPRQKENYTRGKNFLRIQFESGWRGEGGRGGVERGGKKKESKLSNLHYLTISVGPENRRWRRTEIVFSVDS